MLKPKILCLVLVFPLAAMTADDCQAQLFGGGGGLFRGGGGGFGGGGFRGGGLGGGPVFRAPAVSRPIVRPSGPIISRPSISQPVISPPSISRPIAPAPSIGRPIAGGFPSTPARPRGERTYKHVLMGERYGVMDGRK